MKNNRQEIIFASALVVIGIASRLLFNALGIVNFNAVMASAVFAGAYLSSKRLSLAVPFAAMFLTDAFLGFYSVGLMVAVYGSMFLGIVFGRSYKESSTLLRYVMTVLGSSMAFFIVTNFAVWLLSDGTFYPKSFDGLLMSYGMALPFYRNSLLGDLVFTTAMFGAFELYSLRRTARTAPSLA